MKYRPTSSSATGAGRSDFEFDLDVLLHPATAFAHPMDVVRDPDMTTNEKRAILASWASDACAVEAAPELRRGASGNFASWDDIMDALRLLDEQTGETARDVERRQRRRRFRHWRDGTGEPGAGSLMI